MKEILKSLAKNAALMAVGAAGGVLLLFVSNWLFGTGWVAFILALLLFTAYDRLEAYYKGRK